jgi:hypothetical protein
VSNKMTCPGCDAHSSTITQAFTTGEPCPCCGLSAEAAAEIYAIRSSRADEELRSRAEQIARDRDQWRARAQAAEEKLSDIGDIMDR